MRFIRCGAMRCDSFGAMRCGAIHSVRACRRAAVSPSRASPSCRRTCRRSPVQTSQRTPVCHNVLACVCVCECVCECVCVCARAFDTPPDTPPAHKRTNTKRLHTIRQDHWGCTVSLCDAVVQRSQSLAHSVVSALACAGRFVCLRTVSNPSAVDEPSRLHVAHPSLRMTGKRPRAPRGAARGAAAGA